MKKMMMSGAVGQRSSSSSVDGLMLGESQFGGKKSIELGERNSNSQQQQRKRRFQLGESNSNSQQQQRKRQRCCAESVPEEDEIERALDFLKQEAERAEEAARLSHERQQQMVQIQEAQLAEQRRRHQLEETQLRDRHQAQLAQERAQSARDAEFAIQAQWARVSSFLPDLLVQQQQAQSAQERARDATGAQLVIADVTSILGQQPDLLAPAHEQQQAQSARDEEFEEAELARERAREFSRQRALHNERARAQWAQLLQCPIEDVTSILRQRPYLLTQSRDQLAQSARELAQERARLPESRSAEISHRRALYFRRTRAQWAQLLQCPIEDVISILRQRPDLLAQSPDQLAQSAREFGAIQVPPRAQWSQRALLIQSGLAEFARAVQVFSAQAPDGQRRRRLSSEHVISEYLNPRVRPSRDQDKDEMCTVCHDQLYDDDEEGNKINGGIATLDCRHEYHKNCIKLWLLRKNVCPLCNRTAIPC